MNNWSKVALVIVVCVMFALSASLIFFLTRDSFTTQKSYMPSAESALLGIGKERERIASMKLQIKKKEASAIEGKISSVTSLFTSKLNELYENVRSLLVQKEQDIESKIASIMERVEEEEERLNSALAGEVNNRVSSAITSQIGSSIAALKSSIEANEQNLKNASLQVYSDLVKEIESKLAALRSRLEAKEQQLEKQLQRLDEKISTTQAYMKSIEEKMGRIVENQLAANVSNQELAFDETLSSTSSPTELRTGISKNDVAKIVKDTVKKQMYLSKENIKRKQARKRALLEALEDDLDY